MMVSLLALDTKIAPCLVGLSCGLECLWCWLRFARRWRLLLFLLALWLVPRMTERVF
jgi:hypothetical protein